MIKKIRYAGLRSDTPDYDAPDGELAYALGLVAEDGALRPVMPPKVLFSLPEGYTAVHVHQTALFRHFICTDGNAGVAFTDGTEPLTVRPLVTLGEGTELLSATSLGNTLVLLTSGGLRYLLWRSTEEGYLDLGSHLPELPLSFGLRATYVKSEDFEITASDVPDMPLIIHGEGDGQWDEWPDDDGGVTVRSDMTAALMAKVNKFIADEATGKGRFLFPFFVRYAYRLFDGSLTMHSAPVLMTAASGPTPEAIVRNATPSGAIQSPLIACVAAPVHQLDCAALSQDAIDALRHWRDIVHSVDVFVSAPVWTIDQAGECKRFLPAAVSGQQFAVSLHTNQALSDDTYPRRHQLRAFREFYAYTLFPDNPTLTYPTVELPTREQESIDQDVRSVAQFYLLHTYNLDELTTQRAVINVPDDYLQSLTAREVMTDDYDSHDQVSAATAYPYNQRLNLAAIRKTLHQPAATAALVPFTDGYVAHHADGSSPTAEDGTDFYHLYFLIRQDGCEITVEAPAGQLARGYFNRAPFFFLFYPNTNAYRAVIQHDDGYLSRFYEVDLKAHDFLSGACAFPGFHNPTKTSTQPVASPAEERTVSLPNRIYTSEVGNPFFFPVTGINAVGDGTILGLRSAARPLSEGQFGEFPLYAFTTDGVWALEVSATGTYSARQPVTRDVCTSPESITQTDSAVLFATDRGVLLLSGATAECITDPLRDDDRPAQLPAANSLLDAFTRRTGHKITPSQASPLTWADFLRGIRVLYDYPHRRILLYNPDADYAYVFSARTSLWGMMPSRLTATLASWPAPLAVAHGEVLDFSQDGDDHAPALLLTRPFTLDEPDMLKTITTVIQRGHFRPGHVAQVLYASRDLFNWHLVASSADHRLSGFSGTPYKAFRLALIAQLDKDESITAATVQFTPRFTNRPR